MSQELHVAYPGYHAALCGLPRRAVHNLGRPQEGLHQSWTTCAKAKRHNQRLDLCGMLAQELMHINVVKGIKDTIGAKTFMGRASIPIRPFADRPGEPVTDWYDMGKGEWSNDDGTVGQPWHNSPGTLEGSRTQLVLHQGVCRSLCACRHCILCLPHCGVLLVCARQMVTRTSCAVCQRLQRTDRLHNWCQ